LINFLDNLLRHLFLANITELTDEAQVRFQPPDADWRQYVSNLTVGGQPANALNVYLVELRENRKLRSNERVGAVENGFSFDTPAPRRVDCHYLITAWSPATPSPAIESTLDELVLLYQATATLMNFQPIVPRDVYFPDPLPPGFPALVSEHQIPTAVLPVEGFPKYAEFWGTMGPTHPWRPAVYLVVTLPVALAAEFGGALVTTRITEYRRTDGTGPGDVWIQIGGTVLAPGRVAVTGAWVGLETLAADQLDSTATDEMGRFTFGSLTVGSYRLRARAPGLGEQARVVDVPSLTGEYDLVFP
jgi:hypothetical protein